MGYGLKLSNNLGATRNASVFTGKKVPSSLENLQPRKAVALPQWLKPKETK